MEKKNEENETNRQEKINKRHYAHILIQPCIPSEVDFNFFQSVQQIANPITLFFIS